MRLNTIAKVLRDDSGSSVFEYGILVCGVSTAAMLALTPLGDAVVALFEQVTDVLRSVVR